jgi:hypothetical protein
VTGTGIEGDKGCWICRLEPRHYASLLFPFYLFSLASIHSAFHFPSFPFVPFRSFTFFFPFVLPFIYINIAFHLPPFICLFIYLSHVFGGWGWDTSVGIVTGCGFHSQGSISGRSKRYSLLHSIKTGSGAQSASYPMGSEGCFPESKASEE